LITPPKTQGACYGSIFDGKLCPSGRVCRLDIFGAWIILIRALDFLGFQNS
jgi:hypothetical protein